MGSLYFPSHACCFPPSNALHSKVWKFFSNPFAIALKNIAKWLQIFLRVLVDLYLLHSIPFFGITQTIQYLVQSLWYHTNHSISCSKPLVSHKPFNILFKAFGITQTIQYLVQSLWYHTNRSISCSKPLVSHKPFNILFKAFGIAQTVQYLV